MRIARIGQVSALVVADVHPVVYFPFESLVELLFERRLGGRFEGGGVFLVNAIQRLSGLKIGIPPTPESGTLASSQKS